MLPVSDAAGKDGVIKHVMSGVNPQGRQISSFGVSFVKGLDYDRLWCYMNRLGWRGRIGILDRTIR